MQVQETVREDGMRIISGKMRSKRVYLYLVSTAGSAYDPPDRHGLFHYFEHMAFKGTLRMTTEDIRSFSRRYLLNSNAGTGHTRTRYYASSIARKFPDLCRFLCDIYFHSTYPEEEIEKEKRVVLNEIARDRDNDAHRGYYALYEALWRENPQRRSGLGTPESVRSVTRQDLLYAHAGWHVPSATIVVAVGAIDHADLVAHINAAVPLMKQPVEHRSWDDEYDEPPQTRDVVVALPKKEKARVIYGSKFPASESDRAKMLNKYLSYLITSGTTSILWREVREKRGLAYELSGGVTGEPQLGNYFYASVLTLPADIEQVRGLMRESILEQPIEAEIFDATKEWLVDWFTLGIEKEEDWANLILSTLEQGLPVERCNRHNSRQLEICKSVTFDEVVERRRLLQPEKFVTVTVRPE